MRKIVGALMLMAVTGAAVAAPAGGAGGSARVNVPSGLSIRVPAGWHVLHGWLSDVIDPAPRLAVASFPAKLSRHTCECGSPNVVSFPRRGAFVFIWEYLQATARQLAHTPGRPADFKLATDGGGVRQTCYGASDTFAFKDAGRVFQVEVYVGPKAGPTRRAAVVALLDSLRVRRS
jgi:hypothetical protein